MSRSPHDTIRALLAQRADRVVEGDLSETAPLELMVNGESLSARIYRRYNRTEVLALDVFVDEVEPTAEVAHWIATRSAVMPFAALRVDRPYPGQPGASALLVSHALVASRVDGTTLDEVIDGLTYMARRARSRLEELLTGDDLDDDEADDESDDADAHADTGGSSAIDHDADHDDDDHDNQHDNDHESTPRAPHAPARTTEAILAELHGLIGITPVKQIVAELVRVQEVEERRRHKGLAAITPSPHLVFVGNPGTGKTTVARLVGELYRAIGLLPSGHLVETERSGLIAGYLGQTALKTKAVCERALGGVLFIDEAYSLVANGDIYGDEAIDTLLTFMENHRGEFAVVVAGYPERMASFIASNPGLQSRFDLTIDFPDFTAAELETMFVQLAARHDYTLTPDALLALRGHIEAWPRHEGFGNGREVRKLFNTVVRRYAASLPATGLTAATLTEIPASAVPGPSAPATPLGPHPGYL